MIRTRLLLAIVGALAIALPANAQFFTTQLATAHQNIVPPGSDVNNVSIVQGTTFGGASYANNISTTGAPVVGNTLRIVSADVITGYTNPGFTTSSFGGGNSQVVAVFAGQGTVTNVSGGIASASLDSGRVFLFSVPLNSFNPTQPSTWGITGSPLATFGAVAPQNVNIPGGGAGDPIAFLANQVNVTSINSTAGQQTQSRLLTAPVGSDPFLTITTASVPAGFIPDGEGEFFRANTTVFNGSTLNFSAADQTALNNAAALAGFPFFANFGSGNATDFNPITGASGLTNGGDAAQQLGSSIDPGLFAVPQQGGVPEPASLLLWGGLALSGSVLGVIRRKRK